MNHPDWPAFVAAIIAEPNEDTPRLVAADFLEENGASDRTAFIRTQVALARLESSDLSNSPEANELRKKERVFLGPKSVYPHLWSAVECPGLVRMLDSGRTGSPLAHLRVEGVERLTWRRGFVESVRCPAAEWLRHGVAMRMRNPVRDVFLSDCANVSRDAWYAGLDVLRGLRLVDLSTGIHNWSAGVGELLAFHDWLSGWLPGTTVDLIPF